MTGPTPLPIDVSGIDEQLPDIGHEAIRVAALKAIETVWTAHLTLVADLTATQQTVADLQAQVAALTPPTS